MTSEKERGKKERKHHRRDGLPAEAMKERVTFSPDTTSGGGSPRVSFRGLLKRERNLFNFNKTTERTRSEKK
jgi:hypothetical protein